MGGGNLKFGTSAGTAWLMTSNMGQAIALHHVADAARSALRHDDCEMM